MNCQTPNCTRKVPYQGHAYCDECLAHVLRTGRPPEIARQPEWLRRMEREGLPAKDWTKSAA